MHKTYDGWIMCFLSLWSSASWHWFYPDQYTIKSFLYADDILFLAELIETRQCLRNSPSLYSMRRAGPVDSEIERFTFIPSVKGPGSVSLRKVLSLDGTSCEVSMPSPQTSFTSPGFWSQSRRDHRPNYPPTALTPLDLQE
ncbi:hypothetical protein BCR43DRAFT_507634 [Syncephalastrum racemosum]|uniref:Reverse transcriptase domain-containing protein n=1 Tax=Syncephalastrum racemosum TaxID=13706 RepID=A0A1X2H4A3_SYNRA|nr:hypothetical protein BCR43DRAFT_507634 [Syncephalastrum racemosum]